jgi:hypothetical protein
MSTRRIPAAAALASSRKATTQQRAGATSEQLFARTHQVYASQGRAVVVKQHPPVVGPPNALHYSEGAFIDYMGALAPRAMTIAFDVKGCTGATRLDIPTLPPPFPEVKKYERALKDRKRLQRQAQLMVELRRMGAAVAFFCVDLHRERLWIVEDVGRIANLEPVPFRLRDRDLVPSVPFATLSELARGGASIDYLRIWPIA